MAFSSNTSNQLLIVICESYFLVGAFLTFISTLQIHVTSGSWEWSGTIFCKALTNPPVFDQYNLCGRDGYRALCFNALLMTCSAPGLAYNIDVASYVL